MSPFFTFALEVIVAAAILFVIKQGNKIIIEHPELKNKYFKEFIIVYMMVGGFCVFLSSNYDHWLFLLIPTLIIIAIYNYAIQKSIK